MNLMSIHVECYAGAKADETPRRFVWEERTIEVAEVLDRWYQVESNLSGPAPTISRCEAWTGASTC